MIKADGSVMAFFERPIAAGLGVFTMLVWLSPLVINRRSRADGVHPAS
jgi:TctA family transporter